MRYHNINLVLYPISHALGYLVLDYSGFYLVWIILRLLDEYSLLIKVITFGPPSRMQDVNRWK